MKKIYLIFLLFCICLIQQRANGQNFSEYIQQNCIPVDSTGMLSEKIYQSLISYRVIMMGEIHGTMEPAWFAGALTDLFIQHGDTVLLGLEIPEARMQYPTSPKKFTAFKAPFFAEPDYYSGRESKDWAVLIDRFYNKKNVSLLYFDIPSGVDYHLRDSLMYVNIKNAILAHPSWRVITLSGNAHNQFNGPAIIKPVSMADYIISDPQLRNTIKVCAINHYYEAGTCLANYGSGIEKHNIVGGVDVFNSATTFNRYFLIAPPSPSNPYTAIFYTRTVHASVLVKAAENKN